MNPKLKLAIAPYLASFVLQKDPRRAVTGARRAGGEVVEDVGRAMCGRIAWLTRSHLYWSASGAGGLGLMLSLNSTSQSRRCGDS